MDSALPGKRGVSPGLHPIRYIMKSSHVFGICVRACLLFSANLTIARADEFKPEPGYVSRFNGHDSTGWGHLTNNFDRKTTSSDGRYTAKKGFLVVNPYRAEAGPHLRQLWTTQTFPKDFILKLEFRATVNADSSIFIRQPQLRCRDYLVAVPYKELKKYRPQDWNEIVVTVTNEVAHGTCNGEVLEAALKVPATAPSTSKPTVGKWSIVASG